MAVGTMTDLPRAAGRQPTSPARPSASATRESTPSAQGSAPARRAHPLLGAFPLAVMTLATFLVLFTLMMARLQAGAGPALGSATSSALVAAPHGTGAVATRTSGAGAASESTMPVTSEGSAVTTPAVITRASGALGTSEAGDD
jgi:hypothetical protein